MGWSYLSGRIVGGEPIDENEIILDDAYFFIIDLILISFAGRVILAIFYDIIKKKQKLI
jgi:hypothetical protein